MTGGMLCGQAAKHEKLAQKYAKAAEMFGEWAKNLREAEELAAKVKLLDDEAVGLYEEEMKLFETDPSHRPRST